MLDGLVGTLASLACAGTWALASIIFASALQETTATAWGLSLTKALIAAPLLLAVALIGFGLPSAAGHMPALIVTSVLGLVVADTAYLGTLKRLGVQRGVLLIPVVPVSTAVLARVAIDEHLGVFAIAGGALTLVGVVVAVRAPATTATATATTATATTTTTTTATTAPLIGGVLLAVIYVVAQACSNVLLKRVLVDAVAIHVAVLRLLVGVPLMAVMVWRFGDGLAGMAPLWRRGRLPAVVVAAVVGTVGGMWLGSVGTQRLPVGIATTLAATAPVWALALSRMRGDAVSPRSVVGALLAVVGVFLLAVDRLQAG